MYTSLPMISAAGLFRSTDKFSDLRRYPENAVTRLRTAVDYELELFTMDGGISHLNGSSYPIRKGSLLIVEPGDKRQSTLHFSALFIHFGTSDRAIQDLIHSVRGFHPDMDYQTLSSELNDICDIYLSFEPDSTILAAARLVSLLCNIKKICFINRSSLTDTPGYSAVSKAILFMKQHYKEPLTIRQIADDCCLSTSYFHKLFLETAHTTPNHYLLKIRLAAAKSLLLSTALPVSDVAEQCGFHSQAYFSDCFKRHFGVTAKEFRNSAF